MRRLTRAFAQAASDAIDFIGRCLRAWRYMRRLNYSAHLAWIKAAR